MSAVEKTAERPTIPENLATSESDAWMEEQRKRRSNLRKDSEGIGFLLGAVGGYSVAVISLAALAAPVTTAIAIGVGSIFGGMLAGRAGGEVYMRSSKKRRQKYFGRPKS